MLIIEYSLSSFIAKPKSQNKSYEGVPIFYSNSQNPNRMSECAKSKTMKRNEKMFDIGIFSGKQL